jgi:hypothetical protein
MNEFMEVKRQRGREAADRVTSLHLFLRFDILLVLWCSMLHGAIVGEAVAEPPSLDVLRQIQQSNESAIRTYQGYSTYKNHTLVEFGPLDTAEGLYGIGIGDMRALDTPAVPGKTEMNFAFDRTRGSDYRVRYRHHWKTYDGEGHFGVLERRKGVEIQTVRYDESDNPVEAFVYPTNDAQIIGHWNDPFRHRAHIFFRDSRFPDGYYNVPLAEVMQDPDRCWIDDKDYVVEEEPCIRLVTICETERFQILSHSWLAKERNYTVAKQKSLLLPRSSDPGYEEFIEDLKTRRGKRVLDVQDFAEQYDDTVPMYLAVGKDFIEVAQNVWVASELEEYAFTPIPDIYSADGTINPETYKPIEKLFTFNEHTDFANVDRVLSGINTTYLDAKSLVINEPIDPKLFEENIIPDGIPLTNFVSRTGTRSPNMRVVDGLRDTTAPEASSKTGNEKE